MPTEDSKNITLEAGEGDSDTWVWNVPNDADEGTYGLAIQSDDDSDTVLVDVSGSLVDDFEDGDLSEYTVVGTDIWGLNPSSPMEGSYSLDTTSTAASPNGDLLMSDPGDGLDNYPSKGDVFSFLMYDPSTNGTLPQYGFAGDISSVTGYVFLWAPPNGEIRFRKIMSQGSVTDLASDSDIVYSNYTAETVEGEVEWHDGTGSEPEDTLVGRVYELDSNLNRVGQIGSDITVSGATDYATQEGVFFTPGSSGPDAGLFADRYQIEGGV